jgi:hypothetical protein
MGMHTLDDLKLKWQHEKLTAEQMIGQLLQHIEVLYDRLRLLEKAQNAERGAVTGGTTTKIKQP